MTTEPHIHYCTGNSDNGIIAVELMTIITATFGCITGLFITYHSCKALPTLTKLNNTLKYLFYINLVLYYSALIVALAQTIICVSVSNVYHERDEEYYNAHDILYGIFIIIYVIFILLLLAILIYRLQQSFMNSTYALSEGTKWIFITLYVLITLLLLFDSSWYLVVAIKYKGDWNSNVLDEKPDFTPLQYFGTIGLCLYIFTSISAIGLFALKLIKLTVSQKQSCRNVTYQLSERQVSLVSKITKYVSIFSLAISTTVITTILWSLSIVWWDRNRNFNTRNSFLNQMLTLFAVSDVIINFHCLYLHFHFSSKYYDKYCKSCLECCWGRTLTSHVQSSCTTQIPSRKFEPINTNDSDD